MAVSRSINATGVVYAAPCVLKVVHYRNVTAGAGGDAVLYLRNHVGGVPVMTIHLLRMSSGVIPIGVDGLEFTHELYAELPAGVAIDVILQPS